MKPFLTETLSNSTAKIITESDADGKSLYLKGICLQAELKNGNGRIYRKHEIENAVKSVNDRVAEGFTVAGELSHPTHLDIDPDRISHLISEMWMDGNNGMGKMKIIPTPCGNIAKTLIESGVKMGVSSRGSGEVDEYSGVVRGFDMLTIDLVITPSAPNSYPTPVYESLMNMNGGANLLGIAEAMQHDKRAEKYLVEGIKAFIRDLKL